VEKAMMKNKPKVGDIIKYRYRYSITSEHHYGIITKLPPCSELMHVEWFDSANIELIGTKISIWGYGDIWNIVN
jgi:hypothetical protein